MKTLLLHAFKYNDSNNDDIAYCSFELPKNKQKSKEPRYVKYSCRADFLLGDLLFLADNKFCEPSNNAYPNSEESILLSEYFNEEQISIFETVSVSKGKDNSVEFFNALSKAEVPFNMKAYYSYLQFYGESAPIDIAVPINAKGIVIDGVGKALTIDDCLYSFISSDTLSHQYQCNSIHDVIKALMHFLAFERFNLFKCDRCSKYFASLNRTDEKYCRRTYNNDSCRNLANIEKRRIRNSSGNTSALIVKKYNSICQNFRNRINSCSTSSYCDFALDKFRYEYKMQKAKFKQGKITDFQLLEWLNSYPTTEDKTDHRKK